MDVQAVLERIDRELTEVSDYLWDRYNDIEAGEIDGDATEIHTVIERISETQTAVDFALQTVERAEGL